MDFAFSQKRGWLWMFSTNNYPELRLINSCLSPSQKVYEGLSNTFKLAQAHAFQCQGAGGAVRCILASCLLNQCTGCYRCHQYRGFKVSLARGDVRWAWLESDLVDPSLRWCSIGSPYKHPLPMKTRPDRVGQNMGQDTWNSLVVGWFSQLSPLIAAALA